MEPHPRLHQATHTGPADRGRGALTPSADNGAAPPRAVARVAELLSGFGHGWALCGGWAVDAWLGRQTREHIDVDLAVFEEDQRAVRAFFRDGWILNGHDPDDDDSTHDWDGHTLELPAHIHARAEGYELDIQVNRRDGDAWVFLSEPPMTMPLGRAIRPSPWGVPTLAPEAVLFYKALGEIRAHDETDFRALAPALDSEQSRWLRAALSAVKPGIAWLESLS